MSGPVRNSINTGRSRTAPTKMVDIRGFCTIIPQLLWGRPASTRVAKPEGHAEDVAYLVKHAAIVIIANDETYAGDLAVAA